MKVTIVLPDGTRQPIEVSEQATLRRLLPALAGKITLPRRDDEGTAVAYYATYQNEPIPDDQPLATLNVPNEAVLTLHPVIVPDPHEAIEPEPEAPQPDPLSRPKPMPTRRPRERQRPSRWRRFFRIGCALGIVLACCLTVGLFSGVAYVIDQVRSPSTPTSVPIGQTVTYPQESITTWDFRVIDAQYDARQERLVMLSANPPRLHIYDPTIHSDTLMVLADRPTSLSLSSDGHHAAISHEAYAAYTNLLSRQVLSEQESIKRATHIILKEDEWLYAFAPPYSLIAAPLNLSKATTITLPVAAPERIYRLAADGRSLYGTTRGPNPGRLEKIDIAQGEPRFMYDSGEAVDTCGEVWLAENGRFAFTGCGHIWRLADQRQNDMVLFGNFFATPAKIITLAHSTVSERILLIPAANDNEILIFDSDGSNLLTTENLPEGAHGRSLFINGQGTQYYVIVQTDDGLFGLVSGDL